MRKTKQSKRNVQQNCCLKTYHQQTTSMLNQKEYEHKNALIKTSVVPSTH